MTNAIAAMPMGPQAWMALVAIGCICSSFQKKSAKKRTCTHALGTTRLQHACEASRGERLGEAREAHRHARAEELEGVGARDERRNMLSSERAATPLVLVLVLGS